MTRSIKTKSCTECKDWYKKGWLFRVLSILVISKVAHLSQRQTLVNRFIGTHPLASPQLADMHYSSALSVLGLANAAAAAAAAANSTIPNPSPSGGQSGGANTPGPSPTSTPTPPTPPGGGPSFPGKIGEFEPYGCVESSGELSSFSIGLSDGSMELEVCAETCADSQFFAVLLESVYLVLPGFTCTY